MEQVTVAHLHTHRHTGFVVGCDQNTRGRNVWRARVKDANSPYDGQKLVVASVHGGIELARGLNVDFVIGSVHDREGNEALRAVDVCLTAPTEIHTRQH